MQGTLPFNLPIRCSVSLTIFVKVFGYHYLIEWELFRKVFGHSPEPQKYKPYIFHLCHTFLMEHTQVSYAMHITGTESYEDSTTIGCKKERRFLLASGGVK